VAILTLSSAQLIAGTPGSQDDLFPIDQHAKQRTAMFDINTTGQGAGDIGTTLLLCKIPYGRIRVFPYACRIKTTAFGAGRTLSFGHTGYTTSGGVIVPADPGAFGTGIDVSAALGTGTSGAPAGTALGTFNPSLFKFDFYSREGTIITATVAGGTIPDPTLLSGTIHYVVE
jgi:hypothetical protein